MRLAEQALAARLGPDRVEVGHGLMDGRTPLTTITLEGRVPSERWGTLTRQAAQEVVRDWPDTADLISVYLQHDPAADPFATLYGRDELFRPWPRCCSAPWTTRSPSWTCRPAGTRARCR